MVGMRNWSMFDDDDKIDKVKLKLRSYRTLVSKLDACTDLYERLYPSVTQQYRQDTVQSSGGNSNEEKTHALIDMKRQMHESLEAMRREISGILEMIESLPCEEYVVIMRRYTLNERMESISEKTFISVRQCWNMHGSAIKRMAESVQ